MANYFDLDEIERISVVARGWQYARWNRAGPTDSRFAPELSSYRFPSTTVR